MRFVVSVFFCLWIASGTTVAMPKVALVDLYALMLLHPDMREFHFPLKRFEKWPERLAGKSLEDKRKIRAEALHTAALNLNKFYEKIDQETLVINQKIVALGPYAEEEQKKVAQEFQVRVRTERTNILAEALEFYTNMNETTMRFFEIWQQIVRTTLALAKEQGYQLITTMNNSHKLTSLPVVEYALDKFNPADFFHSWYQVLDRGFWGGNAGQWYLELEDWLSYTAQVTPYFQSYYASSQIIFGGDDITGEVIRKIIVDEGFEPNMGGAILSAYSFWKERTIPSEYPMDYLEFEP